MIVASIAGEKFTLASLKDAETLLQILERATAVDSSYLDSPWREVYVKRSYPREISITIASGEVIDEAQFAKLKADEAQEKARKASSEPA